MAISIFKVAAVCVCVRVCRKKVWKDTLEK